MEFLISTVSVDVLIEDLGVFFQHPTLNRDISLEFSAEELSNSSDLTSAISSGNLIVTMGSQDYGQTQIDGYYYDPYMVLEQQFSFYSLAEEFVKSTELISSNKDVLVYPGVFPVQVSSTTSFTKTIVSNTSSMESWKVSPGDIVVIVGGAAAGTYTVATVDSQTVITIVESIASTIGTGVLSIYNPTGASTVGIDPTGLSYVTSTNVQEALEQLDSAIAGGGITESQHDGLRKLVHLAEVGGPYEGFISGAYRETLPASDPFPTSVIWWESSAKLKKIVEKTIVYSMGLAKPSPITYRVYDTDGVTVLVTATDTISYSGIFETSRSRVIT